MGRGFAVKISSGSLQNLYFLQKWSDPQWEEIAYSGEECESDEVKFSVLL